MRILFLYSACVLREKLLQKRCADLRRQLAKILAWRGQLFFMLWIYGVERPTCRVVTKIWTMKPEVEWIFLLDGESLNLLGSLIMIVTKSERWNWPTPFLSALPIRQLGIFTGLQRTALSLEQLWSILIKISVSLSYLGGFQQLSLWSTHCQTFSFAIKSHTKIRKTSVIKLNLFNSEHFPLLHCSTSK